MNPFSDLVPGGSTSGSGAFSDLTPGGASQSAYSQQPKQSLADKIWSGLAGAGKAFSDVTGATAIGEGLGTAAANIGLVAQGKNPNIPVNVPKMAGGILTAGATVAGAGLPIATAPTAIGRIGQAAAGYGALGGIGSAGSALSEGQSSGGVLKSSALGAATGAGAGALGQGVAEGVGAYRAAKTTLQGIDAVGRDAKQLQDTISVVSPKVTPVAGAEDIAAGKGTAPSFFGKGGIDQSETPYIQKAAQDVRGLVSSKDSMIQNVNNVHDAIQNLSKDTVKPFLTENPVPFNFEDLQTTLGQVNPSSSLKSDPSAFSTYNRVKEEVQQTLYNTLKQNPERGSVTDMNNLWDARKAIDTKISQELGDAAFGTPQYTGVKAAARDMRNAVNDFIVNSITHPGQMEQVNAMADFLQTARARGVDISTEESAMKALGGQFGLNADANAAKAAVFKDALSRMSGMYDAISNMAPKAYGEVGKTGLNLLLKQHPILKKLIGAGLSGVGLGLGFKGIESL